MIKGFKHKALRRLFEKGEYKGLNPDHIERLENILLMLSVAESLEDLNLPSLRLHALKGALKGFHAVTVRANWRIVFRFDKGNVFDVDVVDYH